MRFLKDHNKKANNMFPFFFLIIIIVKDLILGDEVASLEKLAPNHTHDFRPPNNLKNKKKMFFKTCFIFSRMSIVHSEEVKKEDPVQISSKWVQ